MMETVEDTLKVFVKQMHELSDGVTELHKKLEKGNIDEDEALTEWQQRLDFAQYLFRKSKSFIARERAYAKKVSGHQRSGHAAATR